VYSLTKPTADDLERLLRSQQDQSFSYEEVGATATKLPSGYNHLRHSLTAGSSVAAFDRAKAAIDSWAGHGRAGMNLRPSTPAVSEGECVALASRVLGLWVTAVCRIVWVIDEPSRYGFAYGTLPHHPEMGEESFVVQRDDSGDVVVEITAFSRANTALTRLAGPVARTIQTRATNQYLRGLAGQ